MYFLAVYRLSTRSTRREVDIKHPFAGVGMNALSSITSYRSMIISGMHI